MGNNCYTLKKILKEKTIILKPRLTTENFHLHNYFISYCLPISNTSISGLTLSYK